MWTSWPWWWAVGWLKNESVDQLGGKVGWDNKEWVTLVTIGVDLWQKGIFS
jgi:hypothetical protein